MADIITIPQSESKFKPHPEGQFVAQCVDSIDLGQKVEEFPGTPRKLSQKLALIFRTGELNPDTGDIIDIAAEFSVSMNEKANMRKFLESWRGKAYTDAEIKTGAPQIHKLVNNFGLISVEQKPSKAGRMYARIISITGVPKAMASHLPTFKPYVRADYWADRKTDYAAGVKAFHAEFSAPAPMEDFDTGAVSDDLPF